MPVTFIFKPDSTDIVTLAPSGEQQQLTLDIAAAANATTNSIYIYNLPEANSLHAESGLRAIYPGLKLKANQSIDTQHPTDIIRDHRNEVDGGDHIIIKSPGEEYSILQALLKDELLKTFGRVSVLAQETPMFEGAVPAKEVLKWLSDLGFECTGNVSQDPDWPVWELVRDAQKDEIDALNEEKNQALARIAEQDQSLKAAQQEVVDLRQAQDKSAAERQTLLSEIERSKTELAEAKSHSTAELERLRQEAASEIDALNEEKNQALARIAEQDQSLKAAQQEVVDLRQAQDKSAAERQTLLSEIEHSKTELAEANTNLAQVQKEYQEAIESLTNYKDWFQSRKKQAEEQGVKLNELQQQLDKLQGENQKLQQNLADAQKDKQELQAMYQRQSDSEARLEAKMTELFEVQADLVKQSVSALGQHVTRSFKDQRQHLQSQAALAAYLETGVQPLSLGAWAIDAELATYLVQTLERESYDLIIEFGSGTSTLLLARVLAKSTDRISERRVEYDYSERTEGSVYPARSSSPHHDLPQRILSFEQDGEHFEQTSSMLKHEGLDSLVDLVLAPLVPTGLSGQQDTGTPLFYACEQKLERVAQLYEGRRAKILVLVDGPSSPQENPLSREPALANLLQYFSAHQLDVLLDDYHREGEQRIAELWQLLCEQRGLKCKQEPLSTEKGAIWTKVSP